ncbi:hypothetical protein BTO18_02260 [Polaribacter porphyrae]|uniref:Uncharacterized protein n=1 Tax=Polaribacter porphyrae TaxID=1137780 RepID=A0A2S7WKW5_9FLAO|nr:hypothetical protein BTO18_02260 [Polaribacter porphyrae]
MNTEKHLKNLFNKANIDYKHLNFDTTVVMQLKKQAYYKKKKRKYLRTAITFLLLFVVFSIFIFTDFISVKQRETYNNLFINIILAIISLLLIFFQFQHNLNIKNTHHEKV